MTSKFKKEKKNTYKLFLILKEGITEKEVSDQLQDNIQKHRIKNKKRLAPSAVGSPGGLRVCNRDIDV